MGDGSWLCIIVNSSYCRGSCEALERSICGVVGEDFIELRVLPDENYVEDAYAFLKCHNFPEHVQNLRKVNAIRTVLDSYASPRYLMEEEVEGLFKKETPKGSDSILIYGDVVRITEGYLNGLTGIIYERDEEGLYRVCFKLHTRSFIDILPRSILDYESNLFDELKFPVLLYRIKDKDVAVIPQDKIDQNALRAGSLY
jgi:hypothetical protein